MGEGRVVVLVGVSVCGWDEVRRSWGLYGVSMCGLAWLRAVCGKDVQGAFFSRRSQERVDATGLD